MKDYLTGQIYGIDRYYAKYSTDDIKVICKTISRKPIGNQANNLSQVMEKQKYNRLIITTSGLWFTILAPIRYFRNQVLFAPGSRLTCPILPAHWYKCLFHRHRDRLLHNNK